jgi:CheY-like chemotaxis protein
VSGKSILFVEDNARQRDLFETAVADWNAAQTDGRYFEATLIDGFADAQEALERLRFDCALFDLRLPSGKAHPAEEPSGNQLARIGLHENGIPVGIISAKPGDLDDEFKDSPTVKFFFKGDDDPFKQAVDWFAAHWAMMDVLCASRKRMRSSAAEVFARRVWPQWADLPNLGKERLIEVITRQYVTQMAELLGLDDPANANWHPYENYIVPAFHEDQIRTGDIFEIGADTRIVLSPQCDLANGKAVNVLMARCDKAAIPEWADKLAKLRDAVSEEEKIKAGKFFLNFVNQNLAPSVHFLPPLPGETDPILVTFQDLAGVPTPELQAQLASRRASVSPPFLSNLVQRFGAYVCRTGQPNIDVQQFR